MASNHKPGIEIVTDYPAYYRLYDHTRFITVIKLNNSEDFSEVLELIGKALETCIHALPGDCAEIQKTTIGEYLLVHSGYGAGD